MNATRLYLVFCLCFIQKKTLGLQSDCLSIEWPRPFSVVLNPFAVIVRLRYANSLQRFLHDDKVATPLRNARQCPEVDKICVHIDQGRKTSCLPVANQSSELHEYFSLQILVDRIDSGTHTISIESLPKYPTSKSGIIYPTYSTYGCSKCTVIFEVLDPDATPAIKLRFPLSLAAIIRPHSSNHLIGDIDRQNNPTITFLTPVESEVVYGSTVKVLFLFSGFGSGRDGFALPKNVDICITLDYTVNLNNRYIGTNNKSEDYRLSCVNRGALNDGIYIVNLSHGPHFIHASLHSSSTGLLLGKITTIIFEVDLLPPNHLLSNDYSREGDILDTESTNYSLGNDSKFNKEVYDDSIKIHRNAGPAIFVLTPNRFATVGPDNAWIVLRPTRFRVGEEGVICIVVDEFVTGDGNTGSYTNPNDSDSGIPKQQMFIERIRTCRETVDEPLRLYDLRPNSSFRLKVWIQPNDSLLNLWEFRSIAGNFLGVGENRSVIVPFTTSAISYNNLSEINGRTKRTQSTPNAQNLRELFPNFQQRKEISPKNTLKQSFMNEKYKFRFVLLIFACSRVESLQRLWNSLLAADVMGMPVDVKITVDYDSSSHRNKLQQLIKDLRWSHGKITVNWRESNAGSALSTLESWWPTAEGRNRNTNKDEYHEYAILLEDDVEVSPHFLEWATASVVAYGNHENIFGVSLYRPHWNDILWRPFDFPASDTPFLLQVPSSWGAVLFPRQWLRFRKWISELNSLSEPGVALPSLVDTTKKNRGWIFRRPENVINKSEQAGHEILSMLKLTLPHAASNKWNTWSSWKRLALRFMVQNGLYLVYPNFVPPAGASIDSHNTGAGLSLTHSEIGTNTKSSNIKELYHSQLVKFEGLGKSKLHHSIIAKPSINMHTPAIDTLAVFDYLHRPIDNPFSHHVFNKRKHYLRASGDVQRLPSIRTGDKFQTNNSTISSAPPSMSSVRCSDSNITMSCSFERIAIKHGEFIFFDKQFGPDPSAMPLTPSMEGNVISGTSKVFHGQEILHDPRDTRDRTIRPRRFHGLFSIPSFRGMHYNNEPRGLALRTVGQRWEEARLRCKQIVMAPTFFFSMTNFPQHWSTFHDSFMALWATVMEHAPEYLAADRDIQLVLISNDMRNGGDTLVKQLGQYYSLFQMISRHRIITWAELQEATSTESIWPMCFRHAIVGLNDRLSMLSNEIIIPHDSSIDCNSDTSNDTCHDKSSTEGEKMHTLENRNITSNTDKQQVSSDANNHSREYWSNQFLQFFYSNLGILQNMNKKKSAKQKQNDYISNSKDTRKKLQSYWSQQQKIKLNSTPVFTIIERENHRVLNWDEVEKVAIEEGFRVQRLQMEKLTFLEQVRAMHITDVLIALHGGGLINALFLPPRNDVLVLHLLPFGFEKSLARQYSRISQAQGRKHKIWENEDINFSEFKLPLRKDGKQIFPDTEEYTNWIKNNLKSLWETNRENAYRISVNQNTKVDVDWIKSALQTAHLTTLI